MTCAWCAGPSPNSALCRECAARVRRALDAAPELYVMAHQRMTPARRGASERISQGALESRAPVAEHVFDAAEKLARQLLVWQSLALGRTTRCETWGAAMQGACRHLAHRLDVALHHPAGLRMAAEVITSVARIRHILGLDALVHRLTAPCPHCDHRALERDNGSDVVRCRMCRSTWPEAQYRFLARTLLDGHDTDDDTP
jgi:ribosomal protein L37AE/L43A